MTSPSHPEGADASSPSDQPVLCPSDQPTLGPGTDTQQQIADKVRRRLFRASQAEGQRFGRYQVRHRIGRGAMGSVYLAHDPKLDREVAIKVLHSELEARDRAILAAEAKAMARLSHRNVVAVYDVGDQDDRVYVAMERVEGEPLRQWCEAEDRAWQDVVRAYRDAAEGLAAAHAAGVIHRDFKPDNLHVGAGGEIKVMDFGLAVLTQTPRQRVEASLGPQSTAGLSDSEVEGTTRGLAGTPAYLAPEVIRGDPSNAASDQFSFFVSLYESLCGSRPFVGTSVVALLTRITTGHRESLPSDAPGPPRLWRVIERGLQCSPEQRFTSMTAVAAELDRCLTSRWRRYAWPAVTLLALGLGAGGVQAFGAIEPNHCEAASTVDPWWSEQARPQVREGLLKTDAVWAEATWGRVDEDVSSWVSQWRERREQACRGRELELLADRKAECLDEQLVALRGVVQVLSESDPTIAEHAVDMVAALPDSARCDDEQWLKAGVFPVPPPEARQDVERARAALERVHPLLLGGKHDEAAAIVQEQRELAEHLGYRPLQLEAGVLQGHVLDGLGRYEQARAAFEEAFELAAEIDAPRQAAEAAVQLGFVVGGRQQQTGEGKIWAKLAIGYIRRLGPGGARMAIDRLDRLSSFALAEGDTAGALEFLRQAQAKTDAELSDDDGMHDQLLLSAARVHSELDQFEQSLAIVEQVLARKTQRMGPRHPSLLPYKNRRVVILAELDRLPQAEAAAAEMLEHSEQIHGSSHPAVAGALGNLANVVILQNDLPRALALLQRSLEIKRATLGESHPLTIGAYRNLGILEERRGNLQAALQWSQATVAAYDKGGLADRPEMAGALTNLGSALHSLMRTDEARQAFSRAKEISEAAFGPEHTDVAAAAYNLASVALTTRDYAEGLTQAQRARAIFDASFGPDHSRTVAAESIEGVLLERLGRVQEAEPVLVRALAAYERQQERPSERVGARFALARIRWKQGARKEARRLATLALEGVEESERDGYPEIAQWVKEH